MATQLVRSGYGSAFNTLTVTDTTIKKECKNDYGKGKLTKEMQFYRYLMNAASRFSVPILYEMTDTYYTMQYLKGYHSLYTLFPTFTEERKSAMLQTIYTQLDTLHSTSSMEVTKEKLAECLLIETRTKILDRFSSIKELIEGYSHIKQVNGTLLKSFDTVLSLLSDKVNAYLDTVKNCRFHIIHGACQFNNVLYNPSTDHIVFIDPRGYFGSVDLYGLAEYDSAKILFALSGYDVFDNMDTVELDIQGDTLSIPNLFQIDGPLFKENDIVSILTLSIWLGNAHCFRHNPPKCVFSFFYAMYLASLYL